MSSTPPKVYPSVDWLTATVATSPVADEAYEKAKALLLEQVDDGDDLKPWGANGFRGWRAPHIRTGRRNAETLIELSGHLAEKHWREFYGLADNVSRLDTCVTVTFPRETRDLARDGMKAERVRPRPGFPAIQKVLWEKLDAGQTLYLGSPKSDRFGRLYDKAAESNGEWPANSWRWEVQERRDMGSNRARLLDSADDVHRAIRAGVHSFWSYHGVTPWFHADGPSVFASARRTRTDLQRRLRYYERCIAPGVRSGIDAGNGYAILAALGLDADELLAQLGLVVAGDGDPRRLAGLITKENRQCLPPPPANDLTPPRPWPTRPQQPAPAPAARWPIQPVIAAEKS